MRKKIKTFKKKKVSGRGSGRTSNSKPFLLGKEKSYVHPKEKSFRGDPEEPQTEGDVPPRFGMKAIKY